MTPPVLLAMDSSTETLCLAVCSAGQAVLWHGSGGALASGLLLARARSLLAESGASFDNLDAVAFARGPGAFTGLRTVCASAQGLAFGVGCGVLPIDSLLIVAHAACQQRAERPMPQVVGVAMDARMGELYAGLYANTKQGWQVAQAPCLTTPHALAQRWRAQTLDVVTGSGLDLLAAADPSIAARAATVLVDDPQRCAALLALAQAAWQAGETISAAEALPLYVRDKVAQTTAERQAAAGQASPKGP